MKLVLAFAMIMGLSSSAFACIGDPESISLAKVAAAMEALQNDEKFRLYMGYAGEIKNINIQGEVVTINLETYKGEKSVRVYKLIASRSLGECNKRTAVEVK